MLKIKDNVDLKELEKFGFKKRYSLYTFVAYSENEKDNEDWCEIWVSARKKDHREICFVFYEINSLTLNVLFDLIQAGLVEKINEK